MFVDLRVNSLTNSLPLLYLPFKRTKRFFKHFPESKGNKNLYIRFANLPSDIQSILELTVKHLNYDIFVFLNPATDELLGDFSLKTISECYDNFANKKQLLKWIHIIGKAKKWDKNHPIFGKYLIVCAFLFHFAVSASTLKKQFRLFSGGQKTKKEC